MISLGKDDCLDVLLKLVLPIYIVDQVLHQVTRDPRHNDAPRIAAFVQGHADIVRGVTTEVGRSAAARRAAGETGVGRHGNLD
jgi:hypothetical protein